MPLGGRASKQAADRRTGSATALPEPRGAGVAAVGNESPPNLRRSTNLQTYLIPLEMNK
jgi:hypothetical protein